MIVLGLDPSLTHFGFAVYEDQERRFLTIGTIVTTPMEDETKTAGYSRRCMEIFTRLQQVTSCFPRARLLAIEAVALPFGRTSMQTVSALGRARGLVDALAVIERVRFAEYPSAHLKKLVCGAGVKAPTKDDVATRILFEHVELEPMVEELKADCREHAIDAAAAIHAAVLVEHR